MKKLRLKVKEIDAALSDGTQRLAGLDDSSEENKLWRDSSIDLMRGLDVVELAEDELVIEAPDAPKALPREE